MKIRKDYIIKSPKVLKIYHGINKNIKIHIDIFNRDNLYVRLISKRLKLFKIELLLQNINNIFKCITLKEKPLELGNNVLLFYSSDDHLLNIYVPKKKTNNYFFGTIKNDKTQNIIKAKSLLNTDSKLISIKDYYRIKSIDTTCLKNITLNFFVKIEEIKDKKNEFNILGIYFYLGNINNLTRIYQKK